MLVPLAVMVAVATVTVSGQATNHLCWYREWTTVVGQWCLL